MRLPIALAAALLVLAGCNRQAGHDLSSFPKDEWPSPGGDPGKAHFSALTDIDAANVGRLGVAWEADLGTKRGNESTPVMVGGRLFTAGEAGRVFAFDAETGKQLWTFLPEIDGRAYRIACCDNVNRGVAVADGLLYVAALDGKLYALDQATGKIVWQANTMDGQDRILASTGAPEVAGDVVVIGNSGAEYDARGYVTAYDRKTGQQRWRFFAVPRDPALGPQDHPDLEPALKSWDPKSRWDIGGGGTPWDAIHYDPVTGYVIVGMGNGGPYPLEIRSPSGGDNLYLSSLVAIDAKTGRMKWHYQETPGDSWDYTAVQPMVLTDMQIDGKPVPVVIHAPKNGYMFVLDRRSGKLLKAHSIAYQNWTDGIDMATGRVSVRADQRRYLGKPKLLFPATVGARNWTPGSLDPATGLYISSVVDMGNVLIADPTPQPHRPRALNMNMQILLTPNLAAILPTLPPAVRAEIEKLPDFKRAIDKPFVSELRAIDPATGAVKWSVPNLGWQDRGGTLATASNLLFIGDLAGNLKAYESNSGNAVASIPLGSSIMAAPMTYRIKGTQYLAVTTGWGGGGWPYVPPYSAAFQRGNENRLIVLKVDGKKPVLPPLLPAVEPAPPPPAQLPGTTPARLLKGQTLFFSNCAICHANQPRSPSPDLRRMEPATHQAFHEIVLNGLYQPNGMPAWKDILSPADADAIHAWLIDQQAKAHAQETELVKQGKPIGSTQAVIMAAN